MGVFMSTIKIENLTFSYYGYVKPVFENVSFSFDTNWKTGLIGRNGIGKSTLFKLLLNQEVYKGKISKSVDFIKFPPNLSDTSKLGIELYKELISDEEEQIEEIIKEAKPTLIFVEHDKRFVEDIANKIIRL